MDAATRNHIRFERNRIMRARLKTGGTPALEYESRRPKNWPPLVVIPVNGDTRFSGAASRLHAIART